MVYSLGYLGYFDGSVDSEDNCVSLWTTELKKLVLV